jgi:peptide/nickel transport system substrate-binding protein
MWPSHSWAHFKDLEGTIGYDLDKARALLKEAGFEKGFQTELLTASKRQFGYGEMAQILQADLKKIGVEARVLDVEVAIYDNRHMVKGDIVMMVHTYGRGNRDPGSLVSGARAWTNGWKEGNWTHFESAEWERWRKELNSTLDMEKRKAAARKLQEIALDECFTIPIAPSLPIFAYASHVKGFGGTMDNSIYIGDMWLDK